MISHWLFYFILPLLLLLIKLKKESKKRTKDYISRYKQIDHLKENISTYPFYYLIHVPDEIMWINKDEIPDCWSGFLFCKIFVHELAIMVVRRSLCVDVYKYARPGSLSDRIVVFKVSLSASYEIKKRHWGHSFCWSPGSNILIKARNFWLCCLRPIANWS